MPLIQVLAFLFAVLIFLVFARLCMAAAATEGGKGRFKR